MQSIPVLTSSNKVTSYVSAERAAIFPLCRQIRNKRGHIKAVLESVDTEITQDLIRRGKPSRWGMSFEQAIDTGHVWALKGVRGSKQ